MHPSSALMISLLVIVGTAESARFLAFFIIASPSHHFVFRPVMEGLAKRGHKILYVTGFPYKEPPEGIEQISLKPFGNLEDFNFNLVEFGKLSMFNSILGMMRLGSKLAETSLTNKKVQELIHSNEKFDAILCEPYFGQEYLSALKHKFNAIGIDIVSLGDNSWMNELAGLPDNPAYQADFMSEGPKETTFWQRLYNTYITVLTTLGGYNHMRKMQAVMDQYFNYTGWETRPPIDVLNRNKSLILVNFNYLVGYPYPVPPHRKDIGGINIKPTQPLPKDIQTFMDNSKDGVIYMSLGSHMKACKVAKEIGYFVNVFKNLPQKVLLKFETEYPGELPPNVKISNWFPQQDILAHNNCVLFITHGGLLSMTEAIYHGVPLVGIPIFADQPKNLIFAESEGFGRILRFQNLSQETVSWVIHEVLSNKRYKNEAMRRSKMFKEQRHTPIEEAVYWIEHILKYPYSLTPKSTSLSPIQLHLIDIKIFLGTILLTIVYFIFIMIGFLKRTISNLINKKKMKLL